MNIFPISARRRRNSGDNAHCLQESMPHSQCVTCEMWWKVAFGSKRRHCRQLERQPISQYKHICLLTMITIMAISGAFHSLTLSIRFSMLFSVVFHIFGSSAFCALFKSSISMRRSSCVYLSFLLYVRISAAFAAYRFRRNMHIVILYLNAWNSHDDD